MLRNHKSILFSSLEFQNLSPRHLGSPYREQEFAFSQDSLQFLNLHGIPSLQDLNNKNYEESYVLKAYSYFDQNNMYQHHQQTDPNTDSPSIPEFCSTTQEACYLFDSADLLEQEDSMDIQMRNFNQQDETKYCISEVLSRTTKNEAVFYKVMMSDRKIEEVDSSWLEKQAPQLKDTFDKEFNFYFRDTQIEVMNRKHAFPSFEIRTKKQSKGNRTMQKVQQKITKTLKSSKLIESCLNSEVKIKESQPVLQRQCSMRLRSLRKSSYSTSTVPSLTLLSEPSKINNKEQEITPETFLSSTESFVILSDENKEEQNKILTETTLEKQETQENQLDTIIENVDTQIQIKQEPDQLIECEIELNPKLFEIEGNINDFTPLRIVKDITKRNHQRSTRSQTSKQQTDRLFQVQWEQYNGITVLESEVEEKILFEKYPAILNAFLKTHSLP